MAKKKDIPTVPGDPVEPDTPKSEAGPVLEPVEPDEPAEESVESNVVEVRIRRPLKCGNINLEPGDKIAEIKLMQGMDLNFLVSAIHNDFAKEGEPKEKD